MATFVQIGDTHIGKHLHRVRLIDDQRALLDQVIQILEDVRPDALLITGDVYDVPSPPEYAVSLLDDFLTRVMHDLKIRTVVIPGNHDAAVRLSFGARAFREELH
ncbi:MAG: exonuclease subunit SbcD, partial [Myxococcota bacterium]|nr:exonuclease subunit SbcD [Myxococcota bacterium]